MCYDGVVLLRLKLWQGLEINSYQSHFISDMYVYSAVELSGTLHTVCVLCSVCVLVHCIYTSAQQPIGSHTKV